MRRRRLSVGSQSRALLGVSNSVWLTEGRCHETAPEWHGRSSRRRNREPEVRNPDGEGTSLSVSEYAPIPVASSSSRGKTENGQSTAVYPLRLWARLASASWRRQHDPRLPLHQLRLGTGCLCHGPTGSLPLPAAFAPSAYAIDE